MSVAYHLTVFAHVLSAVVWLGGLIAFALLAPELRRVGDEHVRQGLFQRLGERFRIVGWICIGVLVVTGVEQLRIRGWWAVLASGDAEVWATPLGHALLGKLVTVFLILAIQAVHDFWLGPKAGRLEAGTAQAKALRRRAALLARLNAGIGLVLLYFAVALARGG